MVISGHDLVMKAAKVSELKARLSFYLAEVRRGETVVVYDRKTPIARVVPYAERIDGIVIEGPRRPVSDLARVQGVSPLAAVDVVDILRESRGPR